jgi:hypothetical protein
MRQGTDILRICGSRHLCVCSSCFSRLELCPVCRSPFTAYLRKPVAGEEPSGEDNTSNTEGQVTSTVSPLAPTVAAAEGLMEGSGGVQAGWDGGGEEEDLARARSLQGEREGVLSLQDVDGAVVVVGAAGPGHSPGRTVSR